MCQSKPCHSVEDLVRLFLEIRAPELSRRGRAHLGEVLELVSLYLDERGVASIDLRSSAPHALTRAVASIDLARTLLDEFEFEFLVGVIDASADLLELYRPHVRDFRAWLNAQRMSGPILFAV